MAQHQTPLAQGDQFYCPEPRVHVGGKTEPCCGLLDKKCSKINFGIKRSCKNGLFVRKKIFKKEKQILDLYSFVFFLKSPLVDPESEKRRGPSVKGNLFLNENAAETVYDWVTRTHLQGRTENETHQGESSMWPLADYG